MADYSTVHTLTKLFHDMGLTVIAEGAETKEELQVLEDQGVDRVQGFALARPMPVDQLVQFYRAHNEN
jgi:EAL domain-containing protein (putative c-di-GMP-specific phosphodiesterase class I)